MMSAGNGRSTTSGAMVGSDEAKPPLPYSTTTNARGGVGRGRGRGSAGVGRGGVVEHGKAGIRQVLPPIPPPKKGKVATETASGITRTKSPTPFTYVSPARIPLDSPCREQQQQRQHPPRYAASDPQTRSFAALPTPPGLRPQTRARAATEVAPPPDVPRWRVEQNGPALRPLPPPVPSRRNIDDTVVSPPPGRVGAKRDRLLPLPVPPSAESRPPIRRSVTPDGTVRRGHADQHKKSTLEEERSHPRGRLQVPFFTSSSSTTSLPSASSNGHPRGGQSHVNTPSSQPSLAQIITQSNPSNQKGRARGATTTSNHSDRSIGRSISSAVDFMIPSSSSTSSSSSSSPSNSTASSMASLPSFGRGDSSKKDKEKDKDKDRKGVSILVKSVR